MSDFPTLRVGELELRKTADGWQYLSGRVHGEPDRRWDSRGNFDFIDTIQGGAVAGTTGCQIIAHVHDDYGLYTVLKTGPDNCGPNFTPFP